MSHLENPLWYQGFSKRFLILGQSCQYMLRMLLKLIPSGKVVFFLSGTLNTTRQGHRLPPIELKTSKNIEFCVLAHLKLYSKMTASFRNTGANQLLLSFIQSHKPVSTTTLWRGCVTVMKESETNINIFCFHSTRSASTSKWKISGLLFKEIEKLSG